MNGPVDGEKGDLWMGRRVVCTAYALHVLGLGWARTWMYSCVGNPPSTHMGGMTNSIKSNCTKLSLPMMRFQIAGTRSEYNESKGRN